MTRSVRAAASAVTTGSCRRGSVKRRTAEIERFLAPDLNLGQHLAHTVALDRIVIEQQEGIEREAEFFGDAGDIRRLVDPVDAGGDEVVERQQAVLRI